MGSTPRALLFDGYAFPIQNGMALPQAILKYPGLSGAAVDEGYAQRRWEQHEDGLRVRYLVPNMQSTEPVSSDDGVYRALVSELLDRDTQGQSSIRFVQDDNGVLTSYFKPLLQTLSPAAIAEPWVARYKDMRAGHGVYAAGRTTQILEFDTGSQLREFHLQLANHFLHHSANFKTEVNLAPTGGRNRGGWYLGASSDRGSPDYWISTQEGTVVRARTVLELKSNITSEAERLDRTTEASISMEGGAPTGTMRTPTLNALLQASDHRRTLLTPDLAGVPISPHSVHPLWHTGRSRCLRNHVAHGD